MLRIRDPGSVPFWPLDPGSRIGLFWILYLGFWIPNPYFWEVSDNFLGKMLYNSLKIDPNIFLQHFKTKIVINFVKFVATKKGMTTNFFSPSLLLLFWDPGSKIRDPWWVKIRFRDPGYTTLICNTDSQPIIQREQCTFNLQDHKARANTEKIRPGVENQLFKFYINFRGLMFCAAGWRFDMFYLLSEEFLSRLFMVGVIHEIWKTMVLRVQSAYNNKK